jgi:hypothetical protein
VLGEPADGSRVCQQHARVENVRAALRAGTDELRAMPGRAGSCGDLRGGTWLGRLCSCSCLRDGCWSAC